MLLIQRSLNQRERKAVQNLLAFGGSCPCNLFTTAYKFPRSGWKKAPTCLTPQEDARQEGALAGPLIRSLIWSLNPRLRAYGIGTAAMLDGMLELPEASTLSTM